MGILFTSTLLLAGGWLARRPLTPQTRHTLLSVWYGCIGLGIALIILFFSLGVLFQPPNTPLLQQLGRAWVLLVFGVGILGVVLTPLVAQEMIGWLLTPPQQSQQSSMIHGIKDSSLLLIIGMATSSAGDQPSYRADVSYGIFFMDLCLALFSLAELCRPVYAPATRFITWTAGVCVAPMLWFGVRFVIERLF